MGNYCGNLTDILKNETSFKIDIKMNVFLKTFDWFGSFHIGTTEFIPCMLFRHAWVVCIVNSLPRLISLVLLKDYLFRHGA